MTTGVPAYSTTPASNVQANTGVNWDEGMSPGAVNNSARANMADLRTAFNDLMWFQYGSGTSPVVAPVYVSGTSFKESGVDVTIPYHVGRRVKAVGSGTGTIYGSISAVAFSTDTTVTVVWDSGSLTNEALTIYLAQVPVTGKPIPESAIAKTLTTRQVLTSGTGATYTLPTGCRQIRFRMVGAGGGGGSGADSGSGAGANGVAGGFTSFDNAGSNYKANGGGAGNLGNTFGGVTVTKGAVGGTGGNGTVSFRTPGTSSASLVVGGNGGVGGPSLLGGSPQSVSTGNGTAAAANTGAGGGGGASGSGLGGSGGGSGEYLEHIINNPSATYTYTIGAGGAGGAGTVNGGAGGSGVIIVDEYY